MAFGIAQKEGLDSYDIKQKLVKNINTLAPRDVIYLEEQMALLINKSVHEEENIDEATVEKNFISFLIRLYY